MTASGDAKLEAPIRAVAVVFRERSPEMLAVIERLSGWLQERSVSVTLEEGSDQAAVGKTSLDMVSNPVDLVIALGGDGTLLRAARAVIGTDVPVLGVNLGRLGFLTAFPDAELETGLTEVLAGNALLDYRFTLRARIEEEGEVRQRFLPTHCSIVSVAGNSSTRLKPS